MTLPPILPPRPFNAANLLTFWRIAGSPLFIVLFLTDSLWTKVAALALAISFELSDLFDGMLARRHDDASDFGALFDPFADSVSRFTIFLCYLQAGYAHIWMVAIIFFRDSLVSFLRVLCARRNVVLSARISGKAKAVVQGLGIGAVNTLVVLQAADSMEDVKPITMVILGIVAILTALSGADYFLSILRCSPADANAPGGEES